jgi:ssDNA-binding replication factor A large subunit
MAETLIADDLEAALISYLKPLSDGLTVATRVPNPRPAKFIRLSRIGGTRRSLVLDQSMIGFWCWAPSTVEASRLARETEGRVYAAEGLKLRQTFIYDVSGIAGVQVTADPDTDVPIGIFTVQVTARLIPIS